jgi:histidinol-phosphate aminotransferase
VPRPGVLDIETYVPGASVAAGPGSFKLSSNESPLGPSPKAIEAGRRALDSLDLYPDGASSALRRKLAEVHGIAAANIVCGAGSDELLKLLCYAYLRDGDQAVMARHSFLSYLICTQAAGAQAVIAEENDFAIDLDHALACVGPRTKMVFIANPNNPTGTCVPSADIVAFHAKLPAHVLLVLDEAYAEYVERPDYESGLGLAGSVPNVVVLRTFSKIHGLASVRLGWCLGPSPVIDVLNRVRSAFNVSTGAMLAGVASLDDPAHTAAARAHNSRWLPWVTDQIRGLGLVVTPSAGNFILAHFNPESRFSAANANAYLATHGIAVRPMNGYRLPNALRISIGSEAANHRLVALLGQFLKG